MDIIQLQDTEGGWRIHRFNDDTNRNAVLSAHHIQVGENVTFAHYAMIGDHSELGDNVHLSEESVVSHHCIIGDNTLLDKGAFVGEHTQVGQDCVLSANAFIGSESSLGNNSTLGKGCEVGDKSHIGHNVTIGDNSYVMELSEIKDGCNIGNGVYIGKNSRAGYFVMIDNDAQLIRDVIVQDGTKVVAGSRISPFAHVTRGSVQTDTERLEKAMKQMGNTIKYDQIATFTSMEGIRCIRAQVGGIWMPSQRVDPEDSIALNRGNLSLKNIADKYIAPAYFKQTLETEAPVQGMRR